MTLASLDLRFSHSVLLKLREGSCLKTSLQKIVKNLYSLEKLLDELEKDGLIHRDTKPFGKNIQEISLTELGLEVAEALAEANRIIIEGGEKMVEDYIDKVGEKLPIAREKFFESRVSLSQLLHVNVLGDHITVGERKDGILRVINIYVKVNGNGVLRLWCEEDDSYECIHTMYAWTLPDVQKMFQEQVKSGNVRRGGVVS